MARQREFVMTDLSRCGHYLCGTDLATCECKPLPYQRKGGGGTKSPSGKQTGERSDARRELRPCDAPVHGKPFFFLLPSDE